MLGEFDKDFEENCHKLIETEKEVIILIDTSKINHISSWNLAKVISLISETEKKGKKPRILISQDKKRLGEYLILNRARAMDAKVI